MDWSGPVTVIHSRCIGLATWQEVVALVHKLNREERRISCIVHPEAVGIVDSERFGGIRTEVGPAGYVLSTGERVEL